jgi:hypothetical protein
VTQFPQGAVSAVALDFFFQHLAVLDFKHLDRVLVLLAARAGRV